jgi:hypothetical protein
MWKVVRTYHCIRANSPPSSPILNFINFDLEVLKPGCRGVRVPLFSYTQRFMYTLLFMLLSVLMVLVACSARWYIKVRAMKMVASMETQEGAIDKQGVIKLVPLCDSNVIPTSDGDEKLLTTTRVLYSGLASLLHEEDTSRVASSPLLSASPLPPPPAESSAEGTLDLPVAPFVDFTRRLQHASIILFSICYLRFAVLQFHGYLCVYPCLIPL